MADLVVYLYNSNTGVIGPFLPPQTLFLLHSGLGWHGPFSSYQDAINYYNSNKGKNPGWKAPTSDIGQSINNGASSIGDAAVNAVTGQTLKGLNLPVWFLRIGEIVLGIILIGIGVAKLAGVSNVVTKNLPPIIPV